MTDQEYMIKMIAITEELTRIASHEPMVRSSWDMYMDELHLVTCEWHRSRHRRPRLFAYLCWFLAGVLCWVIWRISC